MKINKYLPSRKQTLMFSATMPENIRRLASNLLHDPVEINIAMSKPAEGVLQAVYLCYENQKEKLINNLIGDKPDYSSILIFCSTKKKVADVGKALKSPDYTVRTISSDLEQKERNEVLLAFKARNIRILVATDVMNRGIDIKDIDLIINYDVPEDAEDYVHRVGRTARAKGSGVALTLVNPVDMIKFRRIEKLIDTHVIKLPVPAEIGKGPEWNPNGKKDKGKGKYYPKSRKKSKK